MRYVIEGEWTGTSRGNKKSCIAKSSGTIYLTEQKGERNV